MGEATYLGVSAPKYGFSAACDKQVLCRLEVEWRTCESSDGIVVFYVYVLDFLVRLPLMKYLAISTNAVPSAT